MRVFHVAAEQFVELDAAPAALPEGGFLWMSCARAEFEQRLAELQGCLQRWTGGVLVDLHLSDLLNAQLPSHFDDTSAYDLLVFRRLARAPSAEAAADPPAGVRQALDSIDTSPVGFALFDRVLLTVHPAECAVRDFFAARLSGHAAGSDLRGSSRLPTSPAELMLRMVNHMVDGYLDLRRVLTRHLGQLQQELLDPRGRFHDWRLLLDARNTLNLLEDLCEDQRSAVQEWIDALDEWPDEADAARRRERELLRVRSRDVLEHVERVLSHVRRLEHSAETAVQMHFSAL
ncbi:MAG: magnesium transporter CorA, partial [Rubrivivax sp.]|nr:magnesium transporter CorA [Rubrivivax sp.]